METFFRGLLFSLLFSFVCGGGIEGKIRYGYEKEGNTGNCCFRIVVEA